MVELSVVIPVYGCTDSLWVLYDRLSKALVSLTSSYEIVLVDDRSPDGAWEILREIAESDSRVRAMRLSRNFGQHAAITAGLAHTDGRFTVVMDCDLQDPPEQIASLYAKALEGWEVVLTRRPRRRQPLMRRIAGSVYFPVRRVLVGGGLEKNMPNLSLLSRKVVEAYLRLGEKDRQYLLIVDWLGFRKTVIDIDQDERYAGKSSYTWSALFRVAVDGIFFQSTKILRSIVYAGFGIATLGLLLLAYTLAVIIAGRRLPDWTALPMLILLPTGVMTIGGGVTSLYIGKIFDQVKGRPLYLFDVEIVDGVERSVWRELGHPPPDPETSMRTSSSEFSPRDEYE